MLFPAYWVYTIGLLKCAGRCHGMRLGEQAKLQAGEGIVSSTIHLWKPKWLWPFTHIWSSFQNYLMKMVLWTCFSPSRDAWHSTHFVEHSVVSYWFLVIFLSRSFTLRNVVHAAFTVFQASFTVGMDFWWSKKCVELTIDTIEFPEPSWKIVKLHTRGSITPSRVLQEIRV